MRCPICSSAARARPSAFVGLVLGDLDELVGLQDLVVQPLRVKLRLARPILGGLRPVLGLAELLRGSSLDLSELLCLLMRCLQTPDGLSGLVLRGLRAGLGHPDPVLGQLGVFLCGLDQLGGFPELVLCGKCSKLGLLGPLHRIPRAELSLLGLFVLSSQEPLGGSLQLPGGV